MKKFLAIILAVCVSMSLATFSFADHIFDDYITVLLGGQSKLPEYLDEEELNMERLPRAEQSEQPQQVTKPAAPAATSADADIERITAMFTKKFSNEIKVVKVAQQETNYKLKNTVKTPVVYTYDIENNKYYPVAKTLYKVNEDSSISFDKSVSGCLVLSSGLLAEK